VQDVDALLARIERQGAPSTLMLAGPEVLLRDEILARMRSAVIGDGDEGRWSREVYGARETPLSEINAGLRVVGLFSESRLIVVSEIERYGRASQADRSELYRCLEQPSPGIHLALLSEKPLWELERANEFLKGCLQRVEVVVRLDHPSADQAVQIVRKVGRDRHRLEISEEIARRLVDAVGPNLLELSHELSRLALRLGAGARVEASTLEDWLRTGVVGTLGDLEEALMRGDEPRALRLWDAVRRNMTVPAVTWMMGSRHLDPRWGRQAGERAPSRSYLSRILRECYRMERAIKRGDIPSHLQETAFEAMIHRMCAEFPRLPARGGPSPAGTPVGESRKD
jgi:DNA polymerase III delta subunit